MLVTLQDQRAVAIGGDPQHEFTRGFLCQKMTRYLERVYHRDRLLHPLRRVGPKGSGQFERVSWDDALDEIAGRLKDIAAGPHGPQAILPYSYCGTMGKLQSESLDRRFFHRLGASLLDRTICATAGAVGYRYTIGTGQGMDPEAFAESRYIINWGSNTVETNSHLWVRMLEAQRRGAKIITIDPRHSSTAARSDWHLAPLPGTDAALALGMMHVIFRDGLQDDAYLATACVGAEALRDRVLNDYAPARVAKLTGLAVEDVERLAREYATTAPAAIRINYGMQRHSGGGMAIRTVACLPAIIGAWRHRAGGMLLSTSALFPFNVAGLQRPDLIPAGTRTINMNSLAEVLQGELAGPPVQALFVYNSNPAAVCPDRQRVLSGLRRNDLFTVVVEQFATDTVDYADIILPATTQIEHLDLHHAYGHHWLQLNEPVIQPLGECRPNTDVFRGLASRLGFEPELFEVTDRDLARETLWEFSSHQPAAFEGITVEKLSSDGPQRLRLSDEPPYTAGRFGTPSGKCELFCQRLADAGFDPLPTFIPPSESPASAPELAERYPLQMVSPPAPHFLNSTFVETDTLRRRAGQPELEISRDDAAARGIVTGQLVRVFNDRGVFHAVAKVSEHQRSGVVVAPSIWWGKFASDGANANCTTSSRIADFGGGATFFDNLVEVRLADAT
jgi:anaerobic selenocysteine-containing dehydrogenase